MGAFLSDPVNYNEPVGVYSGAIYLGSGDEDKEIIAAYPSGSGSWPGLFLKQASLVVRLSSPRGRISVESSRLTGLTS